MNVIFRSSHGENKNIELLANTRCVRPHSGPKVCRQEFATVFGAENYVNHVFGVCVGHVPHLRRLITLYTISPALTHWANLCRAYGAGRVAHLTRKNLLGGLPVRFWKGWPLFSFLRLPGGRGSN